MSAILKLCPPFLLPGSSAAKGISALEKAARDDKSLVNGTSGHRDQGRSQRLLPEAGRTSCFGHSPASSNRSRFILRALLAAQDYPLVANAMQSQAAVTPSGDEASQRQRANSRLSRYVR